MTELEVGKTYLDSYSNEIEIIAYVSGARKGFIGYRREDDEVRRYSKEGVYTDYKPEKVYDIVCEVPRAITQREQKLREALEKLEEKFESRKIEFKRIKGGHEAYKTIKRAWLDVKTSIRTLGE